MANKAYATLALTLLMLVGCQGPTATGMGTGGSAGGDSADSDGADYYDTVATRAAFDQSNPGNFSENIAQTGYLSDAFKGVDGSWLNTDPGFEHNGVRTRNLSYVKDGGETYLAFKGYGWYYGGELAAGMKRGYPEGAAVISANSLGPGRYEATLAAFPREGGCTALWTYSTTGNEAVSQNEIDIEIGGATDSSSFENAWFSSWVTHTSKLTDSVDVTDQLYLNDGRFHTYTFDWYTAYPGTGKGRIDFFIDGRLRSYIQGDLVTTQSMPLWLGVWFPAFAGTPAFATDYMYVKDIEYKAFSAFAQPYEDLRYTAGYALTPLSQLGLATADALPVTNKIANGDFATWAPNSRDQTCDGWVAEPASAGTAAVDSGVLVLSASADGSLEFPGEYYYQDLTCQYPGFVYDLSLEAKKGSAEAEGNVEITYYTKGKAVISREVLPVTGTDWAAVKRRLTMPDGTQRLRIGLTSEKGTISYRRVALTA